MSSVPQLLCQPEENTRDQPKASPCQADAQQSQCKLLATLLTDALLNVLNSFDENMTPRPTTFCFFDFQADAEDQTASDLAVVLFETATLRSGYQLADTKAYGDRIERMLRLSMNVPLDEQARSLALNQILTPMH